MTPSNVSPKDYNAWKKRMGFNDTMAGKKLGIGFTTSYIYSKGVRYDKKETFIPRLVAWAMSAIEAGLKPLGEK